MNQLKVLSYNIHKGRTGGRRRWMMNELREAIRAVEADVVFLQEVRGGGDSILQSNQFEYLADEIWEHFAYGKNAVYTWGDHGNAILSKYPIEAHDNLDLSLHPLERRGLLHASVRSPGSGQRLDFLTTHLNLRASDRRRQFSSIIDYVENRLEGRPFVMAGDFNDWRGELSRRYLRKLSWSEAKFFGHSRTFPSWAPVLSLDRVFCRGYQIEFLKALRGDPWSRLSDHLPIYFELKATDSEVF